MSLREEETATKEITIMTANAIFTPYPIKSGPLRDTPPLTDVTGETPRETKVAAMDPTTSVRIARPS